MCAKFALFTTSSTKAVFVWVFGRGRAIAFNQNGLTIWVAPSLAIARPSSIVDASWFGEAAVIFFSKRGVINGRSSNDSVRTLAACRRFHVFNVLNQPIARQGEKQAW